MEAAAGRGDDPEEPVPNPVPVKRKWKLPKKKPKHGRNARLGGNKKNYNRKTAAAARANPTDSTAAAAAPNFTTPTPRSAAEIRKRPMPAKEARKAAGYVKRSLRQNTRKMAKLQEESTKINDTLEKELVRARERHSIKSVECKKLAALAQQNRKEANECRHQAQVDAANMQEELKFARQEADSKVTGAEADAKSTIRAERAFQHDRILKQQDEITVLKQSESDCTRELLANEQALKTIAKDASEDKRLHEQELDKLKKKHAAAGRQHRKELSNQEKEHTQNLKAIQSALGLAQATAEQSKKEEEAAWMACQSQKLTHQAEMDAIKIQHKEDMKQVRIELSQAVTLRQDRIDQIESELEEYIDTYNGMVDEYANLQKQARSLEKQLDTTANTSSQRLLRIRELKQMHTKMEGQITNEQLDRL